MTILKLPYMVPEEECKRLLAWVDSLTIEEVQELEKTYKNQMRPSYLDARAHDKESLCEAYNAFQAITEDGVLDCNCCQAHERIAKEWLNEYGNPMTYDVSTPEAKDEK